VVELSYFLDDEVQDVSQVFRVFEFELIFLHSIEQSDESFVLSLDLYLHLWRSVGVSEYRHYRPKFLDLGQRLVDRWSELVFCLFDLVEGSHVLNSGGEEMVEHFLFENGRAVLPVLGITLDKRPAIHVTDVALSVASKQVESANVLFELFDNSVANVLLFWGQDDGKALLFSFLVAVDDSVESGSLPCLGVHVVGSDGVDLDVEAVGGKVLLVDVVAVLADGVLLALVLAGGVFYLPEQLLPASAHFGGIVDADLVVLGFEWLLNERLL
jgi:hypothetical protein